MNNYGDEHVTVPSDPESDNMTISTNLPDINMNLSSTQMLELVQVGENVLRESGNLCFHYPTGPLLFSSRWIYPDLCVYVNGDLKVVLSVGGTFNFPVSVGLIYTLHVLMKNDGNMKGCCEVYTSIDELLRNLPDDMSDSASPEMYESQVIVDGGTRNELMTSAPTSNVNIEISKLVPVVKMVGLFLYSTLSSHCAYFFH